MNHTTIILLLDAGRADHVTPETMPFLHGLARQGASGSVRSVPGFGQHATIFTGLHPDRSGHFGRVVFDPEHSPFRWTRRLGPLRHLIRRHRSTHWVRRAVGRMSRWGSGTTDADPAWIPAEHLPYFRPSGARGTMDRPGALAVPGLFDVCRTHGLEYRYLTSGGDDDAVHEILVRELRAGAPSDLYVADFRSVAIQGAEQGPHSATLTRGALREMDDRIASIHAALTAGSESWDLLVCGPHGMAPVQQSVDLDAPLKTADAEPGKDYVALIHGPFASFWYLTEKGRTAIEAVLPEVPMSHLLDDDTRRRLHIPMGRRHGHRILAAEPGVVYQNDHFHPYGTTVLGAHGHLDPVEEGDGMLILGSNRDTGAPAELGARPLVDVFPTICDLLGIRSPQGHHGASLVDPPKTNGRTTAAGMNGQGDRKVLITER